MGAPDTTRNTKTTICVCAMALMLVWAIGAGLAGCSSAPAEDSTPLAISATTSLTTAVTSEDPTTTTTELPLLTVAAGGDVMGDRKVGTFIDKNGGAAVFAGVKPYMEPADIAFINLEGPITDKGSPWGGKPYTFRARPALVDGLVSAGINVVSLANNHSLDFGWVGLSDCISRLDAVGINHPGAGTTLSAARTPTILETPAGTVAFLAASEITGYYSAGSDSPGTYFTASPNKGLVSDVAAAAKQADFVIVSLHWGTEYTPTANPHQITLAHKLVDAGADLILGHHPHVIQGLEMYKDRLIAYSLGDFVLDWHSKYCGEAFVLQVTMPPAGPPSVTIVPIYLSTSTGAPAVVTGQTADTILSRLSRLSADRGLHLDRAGSIATIGSPPVVFGNPLETAAAGSTDAATPATVTP